MRYPQHSSDHNWRDTMASFGSYTHMDMDKKHLIHTEAVEVSPTPDGAADLSQKKIIMCFDGTTNSFQGNDSDTNVVKLYEMLGRLDKSQYHYYQPGIGTYVADSSIKNVQTTSATSVARKQGDAMFASSFADHVVAGYKFLMRYYMEGDQLYIFGFSRGAYTARFLTEMLDEVGLLSRGNEENLPFLWYHYSDYRLDSQNRAKKQMVEHMSATFCRKPEPTPLGAPVKFVYFLGLWDCVNSVANFKKVKEVEDHANASPNIALHIRHAVSCHERRVLFKPTLFLDGDNAIGTCTEQWFAGNHGDVGGGWSPQDHMLLSDIPLIWMVEELKRQEAIDLRRSGSHAQQPIIKLPLSWREVDPSHVEYKRTFAYRKEILDRNLRRIRSGHFTGHAMEHLAHDPLSLERCGSNKGMLVFWWILENLPLVHPQIALRRSNNWVRTSDGQMVKTSYYKAEVSRKRNKGDPRRIPLGEAGRLHWSVEMLYHARIIPRMPTETSTFKYFEP